MLGYGKYPIDWETGFKGLPPNLKKGIDSFTWGMFDFAHKEVREHKLAIIEEFLTRWDNDGISLDFDRDPRYFKESGKAENAAMMTELIRNVKAIVDRLGQGAPTPALLPRSRDPEDRGLRRSWTRCRHLGEAGPGRCDLARLRLHDNDSRPEALARTGPRQAMLDLSEHQSLANHRGNAGLGAIDVRPRRPRLESLQLRPSAPRS